MDDSNLFYYHAPCYTFNQKNGYYLTVDDLYYHNERHTSRSPHSSSSATTTTSGGGSLDTVSIYQSSVNRVQYPQIVNPRAQQQTANKYQKVTRKPVASHPTVQSNDCAPRQQSGCQQHLQQLKNRNYAAADTVHPNRIHRQKEQTQSPPPTSTTTTTVATPFMSAYEREATRRNRYHSTIVAPSTNNDHILFECIAPTIIQRKSLVAEEQAEEHDVQGKSSPIILKDNRRSILTTATATTYPSLITDSSATVQTRANTNFWYPRKTDIHHQSLLPLKENLTKKIRGLLQPHRTHIETKALNEQYETLCRDALEKCQTPIASDIDEINPFDVIYRQDTYNSQRNANIHHQDDVFISVDQYASSIQQKGPLLTPSLLSRKFLARPFPNNDIYKLRAIFIWIVKNLRPEYHQKRYDLKLLQRQRQLQLERQQQQSLPDSPIEDSNYIKKKNKFKQIFYGDNRYADTSNDSFEQFSSNQHPNNSLAITLDAMHLLEEEHLSLLPPSFSSLEELKLEEEEQKMVDQELINSRLCKTAFEMAHLFYAMALAAGLQEVRVIYGYLKGYYYYMKALAL
ncbi:hypothetical protein BDF20DRAFT_96688 [Mycotypha africana]|uniref:uncharacterized protein n=1 Tax=Mycotypha africana TaxID=64632 RepID=UPI002301FA98|nr:uncharacterized protein BDF20DRAFT_96688 [Mycotypha africana]KAI8969975.1 hypothetical protein BDF20DRAFT_96688 [Mycotypha africana]